MEPLPRKVSRGEERRGEGTRVLGGGEGEEETQGGSGSGSLYWK